MVRAHVGPHFNIDSFFIIEIFLNLNDCGEKFTLSALGLSEPMRYAKFIEVKDHIFLKWLIKCQSKTIYKAIFTLKMSINYSITYFIIRG